MCVIDGLLCAYTMSGSVCECMCVPVCQQN